MRAVCQQGLEDGIARLVYDGGVWLGADHYDSENLVGIVSEFDLLKSLRKGNKLGEVLAGDIMTPNPISAIQGMDMPALIDILQNNHLIRVPVIDGKGKLIGIVARRDILRGYLQTEH